MARFNLRVYGLVINDQEEILLSDERRGGISFTKFPGGGVNENEGILDALHREFREELGTDILSSSFFYFNDFYQNSAFRKEDSLVVFYYLVKIKSDFQVPKGDDLPLGSNDPSDFERFRWVPIKGFMEEILTFPLDREAMKKLIAFHLQ